MTPLNIFYKEPEPDRWFKFDRYPRRLIRRIWRGRERPGGVMLIAISLMKGLDHLGIPYRFNDFKYIKRHPEEIACIIGKPQVLFNRHWQNPVLFGAGVYSHPVECPDLFVKYPNVKRFLVPGEWMRKMCVPYYGDKVLAWPAGIDTHYWSPEPATEKITDFLIYDKRRWAEKQDEDVLLNTITQCLDGKHLNYQFITYGSYTQPELKSKLDRAKAVIFLCTHETQGQAYQQMLSTNTPILAWDRGGYWQDPAYYPHRVKYQPVSSVPYWDERCGLKFADLAEFPAQLDAFMVQLDSFEPRQYILEHLTLEKSAEMYCAIVEQLKKEIENE